MKTQILLKATEMFIERGFKSVTMDDIAAELSISKKTIYQHYASKPELIEKCLAHMNILIVEQIEQTIAKDFSAIQELFETSQNVYETLNINSSLPIHELSKYYPKIVQKQRKFHQKKIVHFVEKNLEKGIDEGVFRKDIDIEFLARSFVLSRTTIDDFDYFPADQFDHSNLDELLMTYYIKSIGTDKGWEEFLILSKKFYNH